MGSGARRSGQLFVCCFCDEFIGFRYTVDFADGDQSNRVQPYELVALDARPAADEVNASLLPRADCQYPDGPPEC